MRCICILTIPTFFGRAGRSVLRALIFGYVIAGPLFNLLFNTKEVIRTFGCTSQLTYNLTKTRFDLMFKPFQQVYYVYLYNMFTHIYNYSKYSDLTIYDINNIQFL